MSSKVLIVDDKRVNIQILKRFLDKSYFDIEVADSGFAALTIIDRFLPDIILMDICMPGMDGLETASKIRAKVNQEIPVIFISAVKDSETKRRALETGVSSFFNKPIDLKLLLNTINKTLKLQAWEEQIHSFEGKEGLSPEEGVTASKDADLKKESTLYHFSKLKDLGQLSSSVAHDINNYLGGILGNVSLIELSTEDQEILEYCHEIKRAVSNTSELTESMTKLSKKEVAGSGQVYLADALKHALNLLARDQQYHAQVDVSIDSESFLINGIYSDLTNIFLNLLKNAYQAVDKNGSIKVSLSKLELTKTKKLIRGEVLPGQYASLVFEDDGKGMKQELLKHVFEPFFTTKEDGTGLGLSSVVRYLENNNGAIDIKSKLGLGTKVTLYFSLKEENSQDGIQEEKENDELDLSGKHFVIMDDDVVFGNSLAGFLKKYQADVQSFFDAQFLNFLDENPNLGNCDYLILDYQSPYFECLDLVEALLAKNKKLFIFIISGTTVEINNLERCLAFRKPISFESLCREILTFGAQKA